MRKVIIVDDEAAARTLIKEYLADYPDLVLVGECNNGVDALHLINEFKPDLVFLDVQMPGMSGFDVLEKLSELPQIIFSTAYDSYALEAFEVNAVDYLLKPYTKERFGKAIFKAMDNGMPYLEQLQKLAENLKQQPEQKAYKDKIFVQKGQKLRAINAKEIIWIQAEKDFSWLITEEKRYLSSYGIGQLADRLDPTLFLRVHRSSIINVDYVQELERYALSYDVLLKNGDVVRVSRSYMPEIRKRLL